MAKFLWPIFIIFSCYQYPSETVQEDFGVEIHELSSPGVDYETAGNDTESLPGYLKQPYCTVDDNAIGCSMGEGMNEQRMEDVSWRLVGPSEPFDIIYFDPDFGIDVLFLFIDKTADQLMMYDVEFEYFDKISNTNVSVKAKTARGRVLAN